MSGEDTTPETGETGRIHELLASRRRFLEAAGAAGVIAGVGGLAVGQEAEETYEFGGEVQGWQGQAPSDIEGETNPTLELEAGTQYEVVWENLDGQPHDFVIQNQDGDRVVGTDIHDEQGETYSFSFEATEEMAQYVCTVHPTTMVGDIEVGEAAGDGAEADDGDMFGGYVPEGPSVGVEQVADGPLVNPVGLHPIPGQDGRHVVVDQPGYLYVHDAEDGLQEEPALDVSDNLPVLEDTDGDFDRPPGFDERGLLGLAFHPNFEENNQLYLRYSSRDPVEGSKDNLVGPGEREMPKDFDHVEVLGEFQASGGEDFSVDPESERVLLEIPSPQFNHNAGDIAFGPDGYLYMPMGDGGDGNDTGVGHVEDWYDENEGGNAQAITENLLGKMLRLDVDQEGEDTPYAVPDDNPLVDVEDAYDEIYAYGLRNPWRISFDDDRLITGDVGQALFEEIDVIESGGNYGWNVKEGFHCFDAANATEPPEDCPDSEPDEAPFDGSEFVDPVLEYPHRYQGAQVGISITGGYVYDGDDVSDLSGQYVFGDWSANFAEPQGRVFVADPQEMADGAAAEMDDTTTGNETMADGNETVTTGNETMADGNETEMNGNETAATGNETDEGEEKGEQPQPEEAVDLQTPDQHPWPWEEVLFEGGENQRLNRFIQAFGRDADGNLYVLASRTGRLEEANGEIFRIVPAGEGEEVQSPQVDVPEPDEETEAEAEDVPEPDGNETAATGNETTTTGNETANETAD